MARIVPAARVMRSRNIVIGAVVVLAVLLPLGGLTTYNSLVALDQEVEGQWAQVENAYQRRTDLVPNLVEVVKGAAAHERETFEAVTAARARIGDLPTHNAIQDPRAVQEFRAAQDQLSSALSRLIAVSEAYPQLRANENFLALQSQLEGTENRITVERQRFNEDVRAFNTRRNKFPTVVLAGLLGDRFKDRPYFNARAGADQAPHVDFSR